MATSLHTTTADYLKYWVSATTAAAATTTTDIYPYFIDGTSTGTSATAWHNSTNEVHYQCWYEHCITDNEAIFRERAKERQERERREKERQRRIADAQAKEKKKREAAEKRARALLVGALSKSQRAEFEKHGYFHCRGESGTLYRIDCGREGNIVVLDDKKAPKHRLCAHIRERVPNYDNMLAQKIHLEHAESAFVGLANIH